MTAAFDTTSQDDFGNSIRDVFAQVTRYPLDILEPHAELEEELGIDSVKLGEVFSVLRERYDLPETLDIAKMRLKTIADITDALADLLQAQDDDAASVPHLEVVKSNGHANGHDKHPPAQWSPVDEAVHRMAERAPDDPVAREQISGTELQAGIRQVFAEVTRYPLEILEPEAQLEEELGIDSVKLGEVFSVLRERYDLPLQPDIPKADLKTIAGISAALARVVQARPAPPAAAAASATLPPFKANGHAPAEPGTAPDTLLADVTAVFAQVTRYPLDILQPGADLEEELGIDSVKLGEVFSVLRERYTLPDKLDIPRHELKTIDGVATALNRFIARAPSTPVSPPAPVPAEPVARPTSSAPASPVAVNSFAGLIPALKPFAGKVALVTGSGRGLGRDIACYLAELGAAVVVNSFHSRQQGVETVEEITAAGGRAIHAWGSVANPDHLTDIFEQVEDEFGALDFFISNASNGMLARLSDITAEHWQKAFHTNVIGLHLGAQKAAALMRKRGGGKIITMSSPASHGYVDYFGCMGAVKAAVESLTKSMAIEMAADNIQVNCVSPGPIYGDLLDRWPESKRLISRWEDATVYERLCVSRDVSHFVAYLLSDSVKLFAGSVLVMDGGISVRWG